MSLGKIYTTVHQIHQSFELNKLKNNISESHHLIAEIKVQKQALVSVKVEVNSVLSSLVSYQVLDKVYLEFARITSDSYSEALNQIAFEILGHQAGVSEYKSTYISDPINIASAMLKGKFDHIVTELADVDQRMTTIMNHKNSSTDLFNELRILKVSRRFVESQSATVPSVHRWDWEGNAWRQTIEHSAKERGWLAYSGDRLVGAVCSNLSRAY